jgi:tetratricopeptide (TPR) repeat protein
MNIPLETPRPRDYFFVTAYNMWTVFMAIGLIYGLIAIIKSKKLYPIILLIAFIFPTISLLSNYHNVDRSREYYAAEYGMNFLNSLEENAIIFTNGDNDTFPLWYAQAVDDPYILNNQPLSIARDDQVQPDSLANALMAQAMDFKNRECFGIRKDISVANYSLMNTPWYIRQLRDREGIYFSIPDNQIENLVTPERFSRPITYTIPLPNKIVSFTVKQEDLTLGYWRGQDKATMQIIKDNLGKRPIYFATTVGGQFLGLDDYLESHVMVNKLVTSKVTQDNMVREDKYIELLENVYVVDSIMDNKTYKDEVVARLTAPYIGHFAELARIYIRQGKYDDAIRNYEKALKIYSSIEDNSSKYIVQIVNGIKRNIQILQQEYK